MSQAGDIFQCAGPSGLEGDSPPRHSLLGARVDALTLEQLNTGIARCIEHGEKWIIANHNMNSLRLIHRHPPMRRFYDQAALVHIDGMPLVLLARILGIPLRRDHRVTYVDWTGPLMARAAAEEWRVFYLGGKPGIAEHAASRLREQYPGLQLRTRHGWFDPVPGSPDDAAIVAEIADWRPHILMVGMGMPRQEWWISDHLRSLRANVILPCGAAFDYVAGAVPTPPRWAGRLGLEWAFRLATEPTRLWKRYLLEPWFVAWLLACHLITRRRETLSDH
jgi:N-acetylglucosaminyldiphosphoundecaprenol N-acetyl-beta-D-mannosaminyltransferase